jgi:hypothetical protein
VKHASVVRSKDDSRTASLYSTKIKGNVRQSRRAANNRFISHLRDPASPSSTAMTFRRIILIMLLLSGLSLVV